MDDSDRKRDWSNSENENGSDDLYVLDALDIARLEADDNE